MPPRKRKPENKGLPTGWRYRYNAYYFQVPQSLRDLWDGKAEFRLGATLPEAHRTWAERLETQREARTIADLLDRYALLVVPLKSWKSRESNLISIKRLRKVFGALLIPELEPHHVYRYVDEVTKKHGLTSARRDWEVLRHAYTKAVEWGLVRRHPLLGQVVIKKNPPRDRYVEDWELDAFLSVAPPILRAYIEIKMLTSMRRKDILLLRRDCIEDGVIPIRPTKTAQSSRIKQRHQVTPELQAAIDAAKAVPRKVGSVWLFATRSGGCYMDQETGRANGFDSLWARAMRKALAETALSERFMERDIRKKSLSDDPDIEAARRRAGHTREQITREVYRLKGDVVKPLNRGERDK